MKRLIFSFSLFLLSAICAFSQTTLDGTWIGSLSAGRAELTLVFHVDSTTVTMDSPDQGAKGIPAQLRQTPSGVVFEIPSLGASYSGMLFKNTLIGSFTQSGATFPLTLKKGEYVVSRPQTPSAPFPYETREVKVESRGFTLGGTLCIPSGAKDLSKVTALVMVTGSGPQDRDETIFDHKPFLVIADYLARGGVASLRCDDPGVGESGGETSSSTTADFAEDAARCISYLRSLGFGKVGVLGHSEGGTVAFILSSRGECDFAVSLSGMAERGDSTLYRQLCLAAVRGGVQEEDASSYAWDMVGKMRTSSDTWTKFFLDLDPSVFLSSLHCPLLAVYGEKDVQVAPRYNATKVRSLSSGADVRVYPDLNHLLQHCTTGYQEEYPKVEETISPEVLSDVLSWIRGL